MTITYKNKTKNFINVSKKISAQSFFLFFIFLSLTDFFGFYRVLNVFNNLYVTDVRYLMVFSISIVTIFCCYISNRKILFSFSYVKFAIPLFLLISLEIILTMWNYKQSFFLTLKEAYYYFIPFLALFAQNQLSHGKGISKNQFINSLLQSSIICSIVAIFAFFLFEIFNINILGIALTSNSFRNNSIRFSVGIIVVIPAMVLSFCRIVYRKEKAVDFFNIFLGLLHIVLVSKTRSLYLGLLFVLIIFLLFFSKNKTITFFSIIVLVFLLAYYFANFDEYNKMLIFSIEKDDGIMIRFQSIEYFFAQFKSNPFFGIGLLSESQNHVLLHGSGGLFYRDDVGIVGLMNEFGIFGVLWVAAFLIHFLVKRNYNYYSLFLKLFSVLLIFDMINLNFFSPYGMFYTYFLFVIDKGVRK